MAYRKGKETHDAILLAAKELFFCKGYTATYNNDIAALAKVNVGLIHYYYRTKGHIALEIYMELLTSQLQMIADFFHEEDVVIQDAIAIRLLWNMMEKSPELLRFMHEINAERIPLLMSDSAVGLEYTRGLNEILKQQNNDLLRLLCRCSIAAEMELINLYAEHSCQFTAGELAELDEQLTLQMASVPTETIQYVLDRSRECAKKLIAEIEPKFELYLLPSEHS